MLVPLDLKRCPTPSVIVLDEQKPSSATITSHQLVLPTNLCKVGRTVSHDVHKTSKPTEPSIHRMSNSTLPKFGGVAATVSSDHVTATTTKQLKSNSSVISNHVATISDKYGTGALYRKTFEGGHPNLSKEIPMASSYTNNKEQNVRKRMWNEDADNDDEFDELCNMVDLSFDADHVTDNQVTKVMIPDNNSRSSDQSVHRAASMTVALTQSWSCPVCNEQFEGRLVWVYKNVHSPVLLMG